MIEDQPSEHAIAVPIEFHVPKEMRAHFSNRFIIQHYRHEFFLSFFEFKPPIILGDDEDRLRQVEALESIPATCVAQLAIPVGRMEELIELLQENLRKHKEKFGEGDENDDGG